MAITPLKIINELREADYYMKIIFTQGACYKFHLFLKSLFPEAVPLINQDKNHVVTLIGGSMYDITGEVNGDYQPLSDEDVERVTSWTFAGNKYLSLGDCESCGEPIVVVK